MNWWEKFKGAVLVALGSFIISNEVIKISNDYPSGEVVINAGTLLISFLCLYVGIRLIFKPENYSE